MSHYDYTEAKRVCELEPPYYAIIMAAMWNADSFNAEKLRRAFPDVWDELQARYNAPGGYLPGEEVKAY